jgi:hypothetical protein
MPLGRAAGRGDVLAALLGMSLGLFARTEFQAVQFMPTFVLPQVLLGGIVVARDQMTPVLRWLSNALPVVRGGPSSTSAPAPPGPARENTHWRGLRSPPPRADTPPPHTLTTAPPGTWPARSHEGQLPGHQPSRPLACSDRRTGTAQSLPKCTVRAMAS